MERLVRLVKENFLAGRVFWNITDLNRAALDWCNDQNSTYRKATVGVPQELHFNRCSCSLRMPELEPTLLFYLCPERKIPLAQAFGYACCQRGIKTYFIMMSELRDKFTTARRAGKEAAVLNGLVRPSCLIIDEVGQCEFDKENTRLFFDLIDRRYNKEGNFNIVFTSNKHPSHWSTSMRTILCCVLWTESLTMKRCLILRARASAAKS